MTRRRIHFDQDENGNYRPVGASTTRHREMLNFRPFETPQLDRKQAEAIGAHFDPKDGITTVTNEKSLREHLARERAAGRDVRWREH